MGNNLSSLPLENEEELNGLFSDFNWLEEKGELLKESRISFDFKVVNKKNKCYEIYRFFGGLNHYLKNIHIKKSNDKTDKLECSILKSEHENCFSEILSKNSLKYFPSLNGVSFENKEDLIVNNIVSAINLQININKDIYPNIIFYESVNTSENYIYIKRTMLESTIKNKLNELSAYNVLNTTLKRWLEFQSVASVVQLHSLELFHGDIKTENMLVHDLYTLKITDISPWKPIFIDTSDLRFWTIFFEDQSCNARKNILSCNLSPERFLSQDNLKKTICEAELKSKLFSMDVFSLGCILNEIENNEVTFTINEVLKMLEHEKYHFELNNKVKIDWIKEVFLNYDWKKRPKVIEAFLKLLNMSRKFKVRSLNIYMFNQLEKKNFHFCKSFPLFFYPLSIILQNRIFANIRIQIVILNIILPIFLELFIVKDIHLNKDLESQKNNTNDIERISSRIEIEYIDGWNLNKLKSTFQNKFDYDLMKDLVLRLLMSDIDQKIFDKSKNLECICSYGYSNIKGFFSIFQLLMNCWDNKLFKLSTNFNLIYYINYLIFDDNIQSKINNSTIKENKKSFFLILKKNDLYVQDYNSSCILYLHFINISLRKLTHFHLSRQNIPNDMEMLEIYNSIYLLSINTLNVLFEILSEEYKKEFYVKEILPTFIQYLLANEQSNVSKSKDTQQQLTSTSASHKFNNCFEQHCRQSREIVVFEIFNFINHKIMKYIQIENETLVNNEINEIINYLVILNIEKWLYSYVILNNALVVNTLFEIVHKVLILILKNKFKLNEWVVEVLTSSNSTLKKLIIKKSEKNKSILSKILEYFLLKYRKEVFISEILPYLIDQLNDKDTDVKCEFCELIIHIMESMEIIFILPYGKFCIEKCLNDEEHKVKLMGLKSINKILDRIISADNRKLSVNEIDIIIHELIESIVNSLETLTFIKYYPLYREFGHTFNYIFDYSIKYNNWLVFFLLINKFFNIKGVNLKRLSDVFKLSKVSGFEFLIYYFNMFRNNQINHVNNINEEIFKENSIINQIKPSIYAKIAICFLSCTLNQFNLNGNLTEIAFYSALTQKEVKSNIRKQILFKKLKLLTKPKNIYNLCEPDLKKPLSTIKGNYLGSIYNHSKLNFRNDNNTIIGIGFNIYQKLLYNNEDIYSCSTNNSINAGIYLHKLSIYDQFHYWNLITDQYNNYVFKFNNNSYITCMASLSSEFSIVTGNNLGIISKINFDTSNIAISEHYYKDEHLLFKENRLLISKSPMIILIGKVKINYKELVISAYSNGDICIIDTEHLETEISFSIPSILGTVIDYSTDNDENTRLLCFITDENTVIIIDLFYLKALKVWKINSHEYKVTSVRNSYSDYSSLKFMLAFDKNNTFCLFDPFSGQINSNVDLILRTTEIKERIIDINNPFFFSSKIIHTENLKNMQNCTCLYCQTQRIRIFGNYLNQYLIMDQYYNDLFKRKHPIRNNMIGPLNTNCRSYIDKSQYRNKWYIFNDEFGNVYQQNLFFSDASHYKSSINCIISKYSSESTLTSTNNIKNNGHKDIVTSLSIYPFNNNEVGLLTSSRDGIISYWN